MHIIPPTLDQGKGKDDRINMFINKFTLCADMVVERNLGFDVESDTLPAV